MAPDIRWILLDVGNVLIDIDHQRISRGLLPFFPEDRRTSNLPDDLHRFIFENPEAASLNAQLDCGAKEIGWLRETVCRMFDVDIPEQEFAGIWNSILSDRLNIRAMDRIAELQKTGFEVALCSNTNREHWEAVLERHPEFRGLTRRVPCFLSYAVGKTKTDPAFFSTIAEFTKTPRRRHLLIDDREENCRTAESAGMRSFLFDPADPEGSWRVVMESLRKKG
jgi:FMN phosphatase YigB (HAD superfamily)